MKAHHTFEEILGIDLRPSALSNPVPKELKIGMIGLGRVVQNSVLPAYRNGGLNIVAACDPSPEARERTRVRWGIERTFETYEQMLDEVDLDVVDINLRWDRGFSDARVEAVKAAAANGVHVLIAKPLAARYDQCEAMVQAATNAGITLGVNQNSRYAPSFFGCRQLIKSGILGSLLSAGIWWHAARGIQRSPEFDAVHDVSIHQVDVLISWFDREPSLVFAHETRRSSGGSALSATLVFDDGSNASLRDDYATQHMRSWDFVAACEDGSVDGSEDVEIPEPGQPRMSRATLRAGLNEFPGAALDIPLPYRYAPESFYSTMADLLQSIAGGTQPWADGQSVLRTMRTLFAIEQSAREGIAVSPSKLAATPH